MVRVQTASRLHFGLLSLAPEGERWPDRAGAPALPARRFGGVGLMVERPGARLRAEPAGAWSAEGPLAERALAVARRFAGSVPAGRGERPPCRLVVEEASPEHVGLGTGTQLALAVGRCLAALWGLELPAGELARHAGRGLRSAVGVHGFERGGFLVEGGQLAPGTLGPLVARVPFPPDWRVVLARPAGAVGVHGPAERAALERLTAPPASADALCRLSLLGMLPALAEGDLDAFGEALFDFNARAGEAFAPFQAGAYASPAAAGLVASLRARGVRGVGQTSWGPTVFAVVAGEAEAQALAREVRTELGGEGVVLVTGPANRGAALTSGTSPAPAG
jgi:beta-RFAP synthase